MFKEKLPLIMSKTFERSAASPNDEVESVLFNSQL